MLTDLIELSRSVKDIVDIDTLHEVKLPTYLRDKIENNLLGGKLKVGAFTSYSNTSATNFALLPNQHFRFAALLYEMAFEIRKYFDVLDILRSLQDASSFCSEDTQYIESKVKASHELMQVLTTSEDIKLFSEFIRFTPDKEKNLFRLSGKSIFNKSKEGKISIRSNEDCFGSIILTQINLPNSSSSIFGDLVYSLTENKELYDELKLFFSDNLLLEVQPTTAAIYLSKPFLLLAGISGTGKSRFVRQQAKAQGSEQDYFKLVPVRPDWHEPSDLLGYVSRIGETTKFIVTDPLRFMVKAWRAAGAQAITLPDGTTGWSGKPLNNIKTYWLCLDEMNLAPVEQYFADYLSVIESRTWLYEEKAAGEDYVYCCSPILPASFLNAVTDAEEKKLLAKELGLNIESSSEDKQLWEAFLQQGIPVPFNLVVAGTVNMDETTHGFSRKVIDRALTFDFGRFFPNNFNQLLTPETQPQPVKLQFSRLSNASLDALKSCQSDPDGQKTIQFLQSVNQVLHDTPFELAYRALNELLLAVISHNPQTDSDLQAVWDDFLMCKVLPRIEGDNEKLAGNSGAQNTSRTLLDDLAELLSTALPLIWDQVRPDLLRMNIPATEPVLCRSKAKLEWMKGRLARNSFTSFWP